MSARGTGHSGSADAWPENGPVFAHPRHGFAAPDRHVDLTETPFSLLEDAGIVPVPERIDVGPPGIDVLLGDCPVGGNFRAVVDLLEDKIRREVLAAHEPAWPPVPEFV